MVTQTVLATDLTKCLPMSKNEEAKLTLGNLMGIRKTGLWPLQPESSLKPQEKYIAWAISQATEQKIDRIIFLPLTYENLVFQSDLDTCSDFIEFHTEMWSLSKEWSEMNIIGLMNPKFILDNSVIPFVNLDLPLSAILTHWEIQESKSREEKLKSLATKNILKICNNIGRNISSFFDYLALRPDVTRRKFQWILRDVWPYCLPYGHLIDKPDTMLVFCAQDDQKNLPYRDPNLPL